MGKRNRIDMFRNNLRSVQEVESPLGKDEWCAYLFSPPKSADIDDFLELNFIS